MKRTYQPSKIKRPENTDLGLNEKLKVVKAIIRRRARGRKSLWSLVKLMKSKILALSKMKNLSTC